MTILQLWVFLIFIASCLFVVWATQRKMISVQRTNDRYAAALQKLLQELLNLPEELKEAEDYLKWLGIITEALHPKRVSLFGKKS